MTPSSVPALLDTLRPFFAAAFECFPGRVMFGSDWPVCNAGGPVGERANWGLWVGVVEAWLSERGVVGEEADGVWWGVAESAYGVGE